MNPRTLEKVALTQANRNPRKIGGTMIGGFVEAQEEAEEPASLDPMSPESPNRRWPDNLFAPELDKNPVSNLREVQGSEGIFNVTVLVDDDETEYLFGRSVVEAAPWGDPDEGSLVVARLNADRNIDTPIVVWDPAGKTFLVEDPRAHRTPSGTHVGVTAVTKEAGKVKTRPGIINNISVKKLLAGLFPEVRILGNFSGSQTTPFGDKIEGKNSTVMGEEIIYRPVGKRLTLDVLKCTENEVVYEGSIHFPGNIPYGTYKIGTTTPPELLNDRDFNDRVREHFFKFHSLNKTIDGEVIDPDTEDERIVYEYAEGTARLLRIVDEAGRVIFLVDNISRKPFITPDSYPRLTDGRPAELHPKERRVTYSCGSNPKRNDGGDLIGEEVFQNQGDMRTYDHELDVAVIIAGWDRTIPDEYLHLMAA